MERRDRNGPFVGLRRREEMASDRKHLVELGRRHAVVADIEESDGPGGLDQRVRHLPAARLLIPFEGRHVDDRNTLSAH